jgi:cell division protease FtsH
MSSIREALTEPLFLVSAGAILAVLGWGLVYLRRQGPSRNETGAVRLAAEAQPVPVGQDPRLRDDASFLEEPTVPDVTFADVAGLDEAVEELREIKEYLLDPERFSRLGATLPRGILLAGPPGTGKTLLTKALAGETGVPFQVLSASSLVEVYVGTGPARVRKVFAEARKQAPSIVLLDELDAIGRTRAAHAIGGTEERESTLNQLLVEMDGFNPAEGVLVVGATNRPDVLDPALLRPGRFDRRLMITPPDLGGRRAILAVHARGKPLSADADLEGIARRTAGFTGADLANVMNEAALLTGRRRKTGIGAGELEEAIDRLLTGPQRASRVISPKDKRVIAYHEAGHVLVGWCLNQGQDVHRVSVVARGSAHGYTLSVPIEDRVLLSRSELEAQLAVLLGGRVAEEAVFSDPTTGAQDDLERASVLARKMVAEYGMSDAVGPVRVDAGVDRWPFGREGGAGAGDVGSEIRRLLGAARSAASAIVSKHRDALDLLADRLIRSETLDRYEIESLLTDVPRCGAGSGRPAEGTRTEPAALPGEPAPPLRKRTPARGRRVSSFPLDKAKEKLLATEAAS